MLFAALVAGQALAYGAPAYDHAPAYDQGYERPCECARVERREEVRLDDSFFVGGDGVGPAFAPPVYGGDFRGPRACARLHSPVRP